MSNQLFIVLRRAAPLLIVGLFVSLFASATAGPRYRLSPPQQAIPPATHLALVMYPDEVGEVHPAHASTPVDSPIPTPEPIEPAVTVWAYPLGPDGLPGEPPLSLFSQPDPPGCQTDNLYPSPYSQALILQYNCHHRLLARLLPLDNLPGQTIRLDGALFLSWSANGEWFTFRDLDTRQVWLASVSGGETQLLDLPPDTYDAVLTPDGQNLVYAASAGLDLGSEVGLLNLATGGYTPWQTFPSHIVTYPRYSPDGLQLAYILMPDTNTPFTIGELWLADGATGEPLSLLDQVDAGHGYPPVWSPNGASLAYVRRENVDVARADFDPAALRSNLYQVNVSSGDIAQLTSFPDSLVYDPVWAPDSDWLAFTADDAVWLLPPGAAPIQVSPPGIARHPAWLTLTSP